MTRGVGGELVKVSSTPACYVGYAGSRRGAAGYAGRVDWPGM